MADKSVSTPFTHKYRVSSSTLGHLSMILTGESATDCVVVKLFPVDKALINEEVIAKFPLDYKRWLFPGAMVQMTLQIVDE